MGSQITLTMSLVFIAMFSVAILGFAINFAEDNGAAMSIADDTEISEFYSSNSNNLSAFKDNSEGTYASIIDTTLEGTEVIQSTGPFAVSVSDTIGIGKNVITIPYKKIFGSGSGFGIFFTVFGGIIVFLFGLFLYKTLRGNP